MIVRVQGHKGKGEGAAEQGENLGRGSLELEERRGRGGWECWRLGKGRGVLTYLEHTGHPPGGRPIPGVGGWARGVR